VIEDRDLQPAITAEYVELADLLERAMAEEWDTPSLCEGWRVREVVAHVTMPARYDQEAFMEELRSRNFDFGKLSNELAERDSRLPIQELLAELRSDELHHWTPGQGGSHSALNHVVVHGLDVTVPLGDRRRPPDATLKTVLEDLTIGGTHEYFGTDLSGRKLEATDLEWSYGSGPLLRGAAADLVLVLCGRRIPEGSLEGEPLGGERG
jgi:uncharacterized protein (TIGR03083 family)